MDLEAELELRKIKYRWGVFITTVWSRGYHEACKRVDNTLTYHEAQVRNVRNISRAFRMYHDAMERGARNLVEAMRRYNENQKKGRDAA